jgi:hypothetical protein
VLFSKRFPDGWSTCSSAVVHVSRLSYDGDYDYEDDHNYFFFNCIQLSFPVPFIPRWGVDINIYLYIYIYIYIFLVESI